MRAEELARALKAVRSGRQWKCRCVAHEDSSPSMIIFDGRETVQVRCLAGCEPEDIIAVLRSRGLWDDDSSGGYSGYEPTNPREDEAKKQQHRMRVLARGLFDEAKSIPETLAQTYFEIRELYTVARMIDDIRYHPACPRGHLQQPAVVIAMRSVDTNAVTAIQRIFLTRDGRKQGNMMLGGTSGSAMKLQQLQDGTLHICEGLETGLAIIAMDKGPVWALGSSSNMQSFRVIDSVDHLTIWADNDPAGLKARDICIERWVNAQKTVEWKKPWHAGWDADDVWRARNGAQ